jgi:hypothetical protein
MTNLKKIEILKQKQFEETNNWVNSFIGECIQYLEDPNVLLKNWDFSKKMPLQKCYNRNQFNYYYETYITRLITKNTTNITFTNIQYFRFPKTMN